MLWLICLMFWPAGGTRVDWGWLMYEMVYCCTFIGPFPLTWEYLFGLLFDFIERSCLSLTCLKPRELIEVPFTIEELFELTLIIRFPETWLLAGWLDYAYSYL